MAGSSSPVTAIRDAPDSDAVARVPTRAQNALAMNQDRARRCLFARKLFVALSVLYLALVITPIISAQQGGNTTYLYDDDGRLRAVLSPSGEAAIYEYDAAGNFTAIRRLTPNDLELITFTPRQGPVGTLVTVFGSGFNQGVTAVSFNGVMANIVSVNPVSVSALVPQGATTGPISVLTPRGTVNTTTPFMVKGVLISPRSVTLPALDSAQFGVSVSGAPTSAVAWSVNGINGGNATVGTITAGGFYTAPDLSGSNPVQYVVRATSVDDSELFDEATANVIPFGSGYQFRSGGLSVRYGAPPNSPPTFVTSAVSVRYGTPANNPPAYINGAVSVQYGTPANTPPTFITGAVSASRGPVLSSLSPTDHPWYQRHVNDLRRCSGRCERNQFFQPE